MFFLSGTSIRKKHNKWWVHCFYCATHRVPSQRCLFGDYVPPQKSQIKHLASNYDMCTTAMLPVIMLHVLFIYLPCAWNSWLINFFVSLPPARAYKHIYIYYINIISVCINLAWLPNQLPNFPGKMSAGLVGLTPFLLHPELLIQRHREVGVVSRVDKGLDVVNCCDLDSWNSKKRLFNAHGSMLIHKQYMYRVFFATCRRLSFSYKYIYVIIIYDATPIPTQPCCVFCFCFCCCFLML